MFYALYQGSIQPSCVECQQSLLLKEKKAIIFIFHVKPCCDCVTSTFSFHDLNYTIDLRIELKL